MKGIMRKEVGDRRYHEKGTEMKGVVRKKEES